jgi:hypothetical protein
LSDWLLQTGVPALEAFVNALTGQVSAKASLNQSERSAYEWGERIRKVAGIVVEFKDQLIVLAGVITTVFVVSKIAAGVTATITLIKSLIMAYNALKTSAIVAGVASAFALNPLLGAGAAALAAGVLSAAAALARKYDTDAAALSGAMTGSNTVGESGLPFGGSALGGTSNRAGGNFTFPTTTTTTTTSGSSSKSSTDTGQNTDWGQAMLDAVDTLTDAQKAASKSLDTLEKLNPALANQVQSGTFIPTVPQGGGFDVGSFRKAEERGNVYNVTVNGALDANSTARQIVDLLNNEAASSGTFSQIGVSRFATRAE